MRSALPRLHAVTDDAAVATGRVVQAAEAMARVAGAELAVHVRARSLSGAAFAALARAVGEAVGPHGAWLVVNDRADVARAVRARAFVAGRGGLALADARRVSPGLPAGRSVHDEGEIRAAVSEQADFLVAGAVYATASHPGTAPAGLGLVREAAASGRPVLAIGGLTPGRAADALSAGAHGVAAIGALFGADDPADAAAAFLAALPARDVVDVVINGETRRVPRGLSMTGLLADLGLDPRAVVVEHNRRIVRRDDLAGTAVGAGDAIELVHFVGGG